MSLETARESKINYKVRLLQSRCCLMRFMVDDSCSEHVLDLHCFC